MSAPAVLARHLGEYERDLMLRRLARAGVRASWAMMDETFSVMVGPQDQTPARAVLLQSRVLPRRQPHVPGTRVLLLSRPTKMPGPSWSLPAGPACPFMWTGQNSICGSCYTETGRYKEADHQQAMQARFDWTRQCLKTPEGTAAWISTMVEAIGGSGYRYMRVHDSGDLFSAAYTRAWTEVCRALPQVRFWFPTKSWRAPWLETIVQLNALPNCSVRPSALRFDDPPPMISGLAAGSTSRAEGYTCPAPRQGHMCGNCRRCWDGQDEPVAYKKIDSKGGGTGTTNGHLVEELPVLQVKRSPLSAPATVSAWLAWTRQLAEQLESEVTACEARIRQEQERIEQLRQVIAPLRASLELVDTVLAGHERIGPPPAGQPVSPSKRWSRDYDCCRNCHRTDQRHLARGFCTNCYPAGHAREVAERMSANGVS